MKKWLYLIFPSILLVVFLIFYRASRNEVEARERHHAEMVAQQKAADDAHKAMIEQKARDDAAKHAAERAAEEAKNAAEKQAKWDAETARIARDTAKYTADSEKYSAQVTALQSQLEALHKLKEEDTRAEFDAEKQVELYEIQRRDAELDSQRMLEMITKRADDSFLTKGAPPSGVN
jgi:vancomycin resistance protein YoaR